MDRKIVALVRSQLARSTTNVIPDMADEASEALSDIFPGAEDGMKCDGLVILVADCIPQSG